MSMKWLITTAWVLSCVACSASRSNSSNLHDAGFGASPTMANVAGASGPMSDPSGAGTACMTDGEKRKCCGNAGTQTCSGTAEFLTWGPCVDPRGAAVSCKMSQPVGCGQGEFPTACDAGVDSGIPHHCGEGEFAPDCEQPALCKDKSVNTEPEILAGVRAGERSVGGHERADQGVGERRAALVIAPNEQIDANTGMITMPGDRTAKAPDGYLWEPALYIAPQTAENGGTPHFPQAIHGWYNNMPPYVRGSKTTGVEVMGIDAAPSGTTLSERYTTEFTWEVSALGLKPGTYSGEFVIHDGDRDRAIGCVAIMIAN